MVLTIDILPKILRTNFWFKQKIKQETRQMKEEIINKLKEIEKTKNIKILFAVESGSRAWGMESADSDYDVRFVYHHPIEEYLKIDKAVDCLDYTEGDMDFVGFDIFKFVKLLWSSNPNMIGWLICDELYMGSINPVFKDFALNHFKQISLYHHYRSMCKQNYLKYLKTGDCTTHKKYLYAMRGLINAVYTKQFNKIHPANFEETLALVDINKEVKEKLTEIIKIKKSGVEKDDVGKLPLFDNFIEEFLSSPVPQLEKQYNTNKKLNDELLRIVMGV